MAAGIVLKKLQVGSCMICWSSRDQMLQSSRQFCLFSLLGNGVHNRSQSYELQSWVVRERVLFVLVFWSVFHLMSLLTKPKCMVCVGSGLNGVEEWSDLIDAFDIGLICLLGKMFALWISVFKANTEPYNASRMYWATLRNDQATCVSQAEDRPLATVAVGAMWISSPRPEGQQSDRSACAGSVAESERERFLFATSSFIWCRKLNLFLQRWCVHDIIILQHCASGKHCYGMPC